ncbi:MAG TPA: hypothetical protein VKX25_16250 [Bryobacteraceae bacterium]|jgi:hypothetical protein|nr:hypothetical protein [Bryobacteraceae bacterium]
MQDFEKLGVFYLGKPVDLTTKKDVEEPLLYESKDLVTHAVCVGMTGSGKTGLCIGLLEEAAIDGIPAIAIDPKGDIANLLLTFPALRPEDFRPWVSESEASNKGISVDQFAADQAELWKKGLAGFGQDGARIQRLKDSADFTIYTPGSEAGVPVSILKSFAAPAENILQDAELLRDLISSSATALLALIGIQADPVQSREHVLLSNIFEANWKQDRDLDLASLIKEIQNPPFQRAGVMDLETFYPAKDRFALAMSFNNLLASPGFQSWTAGDPLDISALLHTPAGKPRISILSIAHLSDAERMFFISLLLNQILSWVRTQSGTSSLRALLYMDEIFGYFPPVANPPSKKPLLTLLKQARAYGLGIVLATQNPVDLDYKGLSNTGTWFIGRLQTERDKMRVMEGLEGAASEAHAAFDRGEMEQLLAGLGSRVFLLNNVHEDRPQLFKTRWTLSYLSGPIAREQIKLLMSGKKSAAPSQPAPATAAASKASAAPVLPPEIPCYFLPAEKAGATQYRPVVIGAAKLHFLDGKRAIDETKQALWIAPLTAGPTPLDWSRAEASDLSLDEIEKAPEEGLGFADLPPEAAKAKNYPVWTRAFSNWLFQTQQLTIFRSPSLEQTSQPGESERDFRIRLQQAAREERDRLAEELKQKYAPKLAALEERKRRAEAAVEQKKGQQNQAFLQTAVTVGAGLLGAFLGRKAVSVSTVSRAATAARQMGRSWQQTQTVAQANESVEQLAHQLSELQQQFENEVAAAQAKIDPATEALESVTIRLKRTNIEMQLVALAWQPV